MWLPRLLDIGAWTYLPVTVAYGTCTMHVVYIVMAYIVMALVGAAVVAAPVVAAVGAPRLLYIVMAYTAMAYIVMAYVGIFCIVISYVVMASIVKASIFIASVVMASTVTAYIVMAHIVMVHTVMAYIVMVHRMELVGAGRAPHLPDGRIADPSKLKCHPTDDSPAPTDPTMANGRPPAAPASWPTDTLLHYTINKYTSLITYLILHKHNV